MNPPMSRPEGSMSSQITTVGDVEIDPSVEFGVGCVAGGPEGLSRVGASSKLGDYVRLRGGVRLGASSYVGNYVEIGHPSKAEVTGSDPSALSPRVQDLLVNEATTTISEEATIRSHSVIYLHVRAGHRLITGHHVMIREHTTIGDRCVFGTYASCDGYTRLGNDVQVGQYAQLSQAARFGDGAFIGGHSVFSDNRMAIRDPDEDLYGAVIGNYVRLGLGCVVLPGVSVGDDAMVGAGSVITRDIPASTLAVGNPCKPVRDLTEEEVQRYRNSIG